MATISQTTFSNRFSWVKMYEFRLTFHWSLFQGVQLTIFQHWFQVMAWRRPGDKPLSEPMMGRFSTHICVTRPQWVKVQLCSGPNHVVSQIHYLSDSLLSLNQWYNQHFCYDLFLCMPHRIIRVWVLWIHSRFETENYNLFVTMRIINSTLFYHIELHFWQKRLLHPGMMCLFCDYFYFISPRGLRTGCLV